MGSFSSLADVKKAPELAERLAQFKELGDNAPSSTAPSLVQKRQESTPVTKERHISPEARLQVAAFGRAAMQAIAKGKNPELSAEEKHKGLREALALAAKAMSSIATDSDAKPTPELVQRLAKLQDLTEN